MAIAKCFICGVSGEYGLVPCSDGKRHRVCSTCTQHTEVLGTIDLECEKAYLLRENKRRYTFEAIDTVNHTVAYEFDLAITQEQATDESLDDMVTHLIEKAHGDKRGVVRAKDELKDLRIVVACCLGDTVESCVRDFSLLNAVSQYEENAIDEAAKYFNRVQKTHRIADVYLLKACREYFAQFSYKGCKYLRVTFYTKFKAEYNRLYDEFKNPTPDNAPIVVTLPTPDEDTCFGPIEEDKIVDSEQEAATPVETPFNRFLAQARGTLKTCDFCGTQDYMLNMDIVQTSRNTVKPFCNTCMIAHMSGGIFVYPDQELTPVSLPSPVMTQAEIDARNFYTRHNDASLREMNAEINERTHGYSILACEEYDAVFKAEYHRLFIADNPVKIDLRTQEQATPVSLPTAHQTPGYAPVIAPVTFKSATSNKIAAKIRENALKYAARGITLMVIAIMACSIFGLVHSSDSYASTGCILHKYAHKAGYYRRGYGTTTFYATVPSGCTVYNGPNDATISNNASSTPVSTVTPAKHHKASKTHHRSKKHHTTKKHTSKQTISTQVTSNNASSYACIIVKK